MEKDKKNNPNVGDLNKSKLENLENKSENSPVVDKAELKKVEGAEREKNSEGFDKKKNFSNRNFGDKKQQFSKKKTFEKEDLQSVVLDVRRISKTTAGGKTIRMSVLVAIGDKNGKVGVGTGKAKEVFLAIRKAENAAKKSLVNIPLLRKSTVPHDVLVKFKSTKVLIKKAYSKYGIKTQGAAKKIFEIAGIKDVVCKCYGNKGSVNNIAYGIIKGFRNLESLKDLSEKLNKGVSDLIKRSKAIA